jgi:hypothetical protein
LQLVSEPPTNEILIALDAGHTQPSAPLVPSLKNLSNLSNLSSRLSGPR